MKTLIRLVGIVVLICSFLPTAPSAVAQPRQQTAAPLVSQTNVAPNDEWSTPCSPKPWANNPELRELGYEVVDVALESVNDLIQLSDNWYYFPSNFYKLFVQVKIGSLHHHFEVDAKRSIIPNSDLETFTREYRFYSPHTGTKSKTGYDVDSLFHLNLIHNSLSESGAIVNIERDIYTFVFDIPDRFTAPTLALTPTANGVVSFRSIYIDPRLNLQIVPGINYTQPAQINSLECSSFDNPFSANRVVQHSDTQIQYARTLNSSDVYTLIHLGKLRTIPANEEYVVFKFILSNIGNHILEPYFKSLVIDNQRKVHSSAHLDRDFNNPSEYTDQDVSLLPFSSTIVYKVFILPKNTRFDVFVTTTPCDIRDWRSGPSFNAQEMPYSITNEECVDYFHYPNSRVEQTPVREKSICASSMTNNANATPLHIGQTYNTDDFTVCVSNLIKGDDALRMLCTSSNCEGKFLEHIDNFQRKNHVNFTLAQVEVKLKKDNPHGDYMEISNLYVRTAGETRCFQFTYEQSDQNCVTRSPRNIRGFNFVQFPEPLDFNGIFLAGGIYRGWIRFWTPQNEKAKILMMTFFPNSSVSLFVPSVQCIPQQFFHSLYYWRGYCDANKQTTSPNPIGNYSEDSVAYFYYR